VKRLKRFKKELPAAESSLRELLSQQPTPEDGWTSFLAEAKVELQHVAQGMLRDNCQGMAAFCCYDIGALGKPHEIGRAGACHSVCECDTSLSRCMLVCCLCPRMCMCLYLDAVLLR